MTNNTDNNLSFDDYPHLTKYEYLHLIDKKAIAQQEAFNKALTELFIKLAEEDNPEKRDALLAAHFEDYKTRLMPTVWERNAKEGSNDASKVSIEN